MTFQEIFGQYTWEEISQQIYGKEGADVRFALHKKGKRDLHDFMALLSPAAESFLEEMAVLSQKITQRRFGKVIQMYIPLYLSNECQNICTYCGFSLTNPINRLTLTPEQVLSEVDIIKGYGFDHILLVTGESTHVDLSYFQEILDAIRPFFSQISMEVQPLKESEYCQLIAAGLSAVYVYQETYGPLYANYHPKGRKRDFEYRLTTPDRLGQAGIHKIGLGCLLGLDDWRTDSWFTGLHLDYLEKKYWKTKFSISFPRIRPATGCIEPQVILSNRQMVQLICAYRIFNANVELSLSTRETENFRDHVVALGITSMSAGSKTDPGGYSQQEKALEQFTIEDSRSPQKIASILQSSGYEAVWKDWDIAIDMTT
ncbi:MAG: 2-iminoacetate synthase ThiH [SAR324 cluster bacterium]|nr:2-iminoacetate synthase ThiH [SAR324 cluster bacterium]